MEHTKGGWVVRGCLVRTVKEGGLVIAQCYGSGRAELEANAKLMAAAPKLLDVLKQSRRVLQGAIATIINSPSYSTIFHSMQNQIDNIEQAIAEAE